MDKCTCNHTPLTDAQRSHLIETHLPLVHRMVGTLLRRQRVPGVERDDLIQEGTIGLITAVDTYDPRHGTALETWAHVCIRREIQRAVRKAAKLQLGDELFVEIASAHVTEPSPAAAVEERLSREEAIERLDPIRRDVVRMRTVELLPIREIAPKVQLSTRQTRRVLTRGLADLRTLCLN